MRISDWSSDVCSSDLAIFDLELGDVERAQRARPAVADAGQGEGRRTIRAGLPRVIVRHDGVDALVQIVDPERAGTRNTGHDVGPAAMVVREIGRAHV